MANLVKGGFRPWGTFSGGVGVFPGFKLQEVANNNTTGIFRGDIISQVADGTVAVSVAGDNQKLVGVAEDFSYLIQGKRTPAAYIPASTTFTPSTVGSPNASWVRYIPLTADLILEVDADAAPTPSATVAVAVGYIGENVDLIPGTGDTITGQSAMLIQLSTHATTTANFRIVGITEYPHFTNNDVTLTRAKYLVVCNEGVLPPYSTVGV